MPVYDLVGNRLSSHISSHSLYGYQTGYGGNELISDDQANYEYDALGNLLAKIDLGGQRTEFSYDYRNRLVAARHLDASGVETSRSAYVYDMANRRVAAVENGVKRKFVYDGLNAIVVLDSDNQVVERRLFSRVTDDLLGEANASGFRWTLRDQVGTVRSLIDESGSVKTQYTYDSFGRLLAEAGEAAENDVLFAGREASRVTGLQYHRARWYDPSKGRFTAVDPREPLNFVYGRNNPLVFVDPLGTTAIIDFVTIVRAEVMGSNLVIIGQLSNGLYLKVVIELTTGEIVFMTSLL